jgi:hypothetical protein
MHGNKCMARQQISIQSGSIMKKANLLILLGVLTPTLLDHSGTANKKPVTDEEIWNYIQDNQRLFQYFIGYSKVPKRLKADLMGELKILVFKRIKAGDLEKRNLSSIITYALKSASRNIHRQLEAPLGISAGTTTSIPITEIATILNTYPFPEAFKLIKQYVFPRRSDLEISTILDNLFFRKNLPTSGKATTWMTSPVGSSPYVYLPNLVGSELPTPQEMLLSKQTDERVRQAIIDLFSAPPDKKFVRGFRAWMNIDDRALYAFARRYNLEELAHEYARPSFHQLIGTLQIKFPPQKQDEELVRSHNARSTNTSLYLTPLTTIGEELGLSRERVRQLLFVPEKYIRDRMSQ